MEDTDRVLCECGSLVSLRNKYCGFCGNRIESLHTNYVRPGAYPIATIPKPKVEYGYGEETDFGMTSPAWIKTEKIRKTSIRKTETRSKTSIKTQLRAGSPVPLFLMMTSVMIWIGGVIFFFVEVTF